MRRSSFQFGLPLLSRELSELAARRRTYVVRVAYACLLFGAVGMIMASEAMIARSRWAPMLGIGRQFFHVVLGFQFVGIYLFMPVLACGAITHEKERSTLELLLLTRLRPADVVFEKLLSRCVPMLTFLCLSLPLLAFAYTLGGISPMELPRAAWLAVLAMLQAGCTAILCSAWFRTTVGAFVASYLALLLPFIVCVIYVYNQPFTTHWHWMALYLPLVYQAVLRESLGAVFVLSLPMLGWSLACLLLAAVCVRRRASLPGGNRLLKWFHRLDGVVKWLNDRLCSGRIVFHERTELPDLEPVAWREIEKAALGAPRFLIRVLLALEVPVCVFCFLALPAAMRGKFGPLPIAFNCVWMVVLLLVAVKSASVISAERSRQTLETLLTTPLTGREILLQKMQGVQVLNWVLRVPLLTILLCEFVGICYTERYAGSLFLQVAAILVDLPMVAWLGCWIGLRSRNQSRAILTTVGVLCGWCVAAYYAVWFLPSPFVPALALAERRQFQNALVALSPAKALLMTLPVPDFVYAPMAMVGFCGSFAIWQLFRWQCLRRVNQRLGRTHESRSDWLSEVAEKLEAQRRQAN